MTIRTATRHDEPQIQELIEAVYAEYFFGWEPDGYIRDIYDIEANYADPDRFWVSELEGEIIACIGIRIFPCIPGTPGEIVGMGKHAGIAGADCELVRLYAQSKARGRGVGRALCETCIGYARSKGCERMQIWSDTGLTLSHPLYEKLGAVRVGERTWLPPDGWTEYGFVLDLKR